MLAVSDVAIVVRDRKAAARWWSEKFGFAVHTIGGPNGHAVLIAPPGDRFVLHLCEGIAPVEPGNTGVGFVTDELGPLVRRLAARGVQFVEPLAPGGRGSAKFRDPDGNVYWLLGAPGPFIARELRRRARVPKASSRRAGPAPRGSTAKRAALRRRRRVGSVRGGRRR